MNKLIAIIPMWDGGEFLPFLIPNLQRQVDEIVVVWSRYSNFRNELSHELIEYDKTHYVNWEPRKGRPPHDNETEKRNYGLMAAIEFGASHILMCDVDEFYLTEDFNLEKERLYSSNLNGFVCGLRCYFGSPTLTIGSEPTRVPFIMKVDRNTRFGFFKNFPFAYERSGIPRIDPTRRLNIYGGVEWSDVTMHHFSYVRRDISLKIDNSSARNNLLKSTVIDDFNNAKEGYFCKYYQKTLIKCGNIFGLPNNL